MTNALRIFVVMYVAASMALISGFAHETLPAGYPLGLLDSGLVAFWLLVARVAWRMPC